MKFITNKIFEPKIKLKKLEELNKILIENIERCNFDILSSRYRVIKVSFKKKKESF
jgi:hypothetical protein